MLLTHWPLWVVVVIFKSVIYKHILWIKFINTSCEIVFKWMPQDTFAVNIGSENGLITSSDKSLSNVDPDLYRHMVSLGYDELKQFKNKSYRAWSSHRDMPYSIAMPVEHASVQNQQGRCLHCQTGAVWAPVLWHGGWEWAALWPPHSYAGSDQMPCASGQPRIHREHHSGPRNKVLRA